MMRTYRKENIKMFEKIKAMLTDELDVDASIITKDSQFIEDLKLNSLEIADLIVLCEDNFGIEIDEGDIHTIVTVGDLAEYLEAKVG